MRLRNCNARLMTILIWKWVKEGLDATDVWSLLAGVTYGAEITDIWPLLAGVTYGAEITDIWSLLAGVTYRSDLRETYLGLAKDMEDQHGELDLTSEGFSDRCSGSEPQNKNTFHRRSQRKITDGRIRTYFKCCRVFALLAMPAAVVSGHLSIWRVHCPRCGRLSEIPVED